MCSGSNLFQFDILLESISLENNFPKENTYRIKFKFLSFPSVVLLECTEIEKSGHINLQAASGKSCFFAMEYQQLDNLLKENGSIYFSIEANNQILGECLVKIGKNDLACSSNTILANKGTAKLFTKSDEEFCELKLCYNLYVIGNSSQVLSGRNFGKSLVQDQATATHDLSPPKTAISCQTVHHKRKNKQNQTGLSNFQEASSQTETEFQNHYFVLPNSTAVNTQLGQNGTEIASLQEGEAQNARKEVRNDVRFTDFLKQFSKNAAGKHNDLPILTALARELEKTSIKEDQSKNILFKNNHKQKKLNNQKTPGFHMGHKSWTSGQSFNLYARIYNPRNFSVAPTKTTLLRQNFGHLYRPREITGTPIKERNYKNSNFTAKKSKKDASTSMYGAETNQTANGLQEKQIQTDNNNHNSAETQTDHKISKQNSALRRNSSAAMKRRQRSRKSIQSGEQELLNTSIRVAYSNKIDKSPTYSADFESDDHETSAQKMFIRSRSIHSFDDDGSMNSLPQTENTSTFRSKESVVSNSGRSERSLKTQMSPHFSLKNDLTQLDAKKAASVKTAKESSSESAASVKTAADSASEGAASVKTEESSASGATKSSASKNSASISSGYLPEDTDKNLALSQATSDLMASFSTVKSRQNSLQSPEKTPLSENMPWNSSNTMKFPMPPLSPVSKYLADIRHKDIIKNLANEEEESLPSINTDSVSSYVPTEMS